MVVFFLLLQIMDDVLVDCRNFSGFRRKFSDYCRNFFRYRRNYPISS